MEENRLRLTSTVGLYQTLLSKDQHVFPDWVNTSSPSSNYSELEMAGTDWSRENPSWLMFCYAERDKASTTQLTLIPLGLTNCISLATYSLCK